MKIASLNNTLSGFYFPYDFKLLKNSGATTLATDFRAPVQQKPALRLATKMAVPPSNSIRIA